MDSNVQFGFNSSLSRISFKDTVDRKIALYAAGVLFGLLSLLNNISLGIVNIFMALKYAKFHFHHLRNKISDIPWSYICSLESDNKVAPYTTK